MLDLTEQISAFANSLNDEIGGMQEEIERLRAANEEIAMHVGQHGCNIIGVTKERDLLRTELGKAREALEGCADISVDFIPTDYPDRREIMRAREVLRSIEESGVMK